jgi:hypothetical protein
MFNARAHFPDLQLCRRRSISPTCSPFVITLNYAVQAERPRSPATTYMVSSAWLSLPVCSM